MNLKALNSYGIYQYTCNPLLNLNLKNYSRTIAANECNLLINSKQHVWYCNSVLCSANSVLIYLFDLKIFLFLFLSVKTVSFHF